MNAKNGWRRGQHIVAVALAVGLMLAADGSAQAAIRGHAGPRSGAVTPSVMRGSVGYLPQIWQTYNNCGPTSVVEVLAYWGIVRTQYQAQRVLRADNSPRGMTPYGVPSYARSLGMQALIGVMGTPRLIKALVSNGFPPIVNQWYSVSDHTRHYRPVQAYDDRQGLFVSSDPFGGPGHAISYSDFAPMWAVSNDRFIVLYPPARERLLKAVLASAGWDKTAAYAADLARTQARLQARVAAASQRAGAAHYYPALNMAWDSLELGRYAAARAQLRQAAANGASPIVVQWIAGEIPA